MMKCQLRRLSSCSRLLFAHVISFVLVITVVASNNHRSTTKSPKLRHHLPGTAFISGTHLFQYRRQRSGQAPSNAYLSRPGVDPRTDGSRPNGITVNDEAWFLGDGGFAARHLEDDDRISAKKSEEEFFRERSLTVYDQMREASLLLLAQQQVLAAEEAREEASRPRFVPASAGGSGVARVQARRDRQKTNAAATGLIPPLSPTSSPAGERRNSETDAVVGIPTDPAALSGRSLGVGGLDEELEEIRRRVCVPLAAPVHLLEDLGISPVRGLLLHGPPGCGKTLLARRLSALLTPRPPTVVSGPEILERFVGSSEANVRALFDYPPDVPGGGDAEQAGALHVIVLDEFDSIGQKRGGGGKGNDGGDRVRDSVVNQLLARMDGFEELKRPTLLVALTNRIDLLDAALLRPGRFEVQIEIPGPDQAGREAILKIHTRRMNEAGRIDTPAADDTTGGGTGYDGLISSLAAVTDGFTGAELAGLVRAAASFALERAVSGGDRASAAAKCKVTAEDFGRGLADVNRSNISVDGPIKGSRTLTHGGSVTGGDRRVGSNAESMSGSQANHSQDRFNEESEAVAEAAEGAKRFEDRIEGGLSPEDLASVQRLLLREKEANSSSSSSSNSNSSQKDEEDDLLLDAAHIVARRRRSSTARPINAGDDGDVKARDSRRLGKEKQDASPGREGEGSLPTKRPTMKKFEHTGWFHTYE